MDSLKMTRQQAVMSAAKGSKALPVARPAQSSRSLIVAASAPGVAQAASSDLLQTIARLEQRLAQVEGAARVGLAPPQPKTADCPTKTEIAGLFNKWNAALATLNPETVADLYAADGILLPTVSNKVRTSRAEIVDYFTNFLKLKPQGVINESHVSVMSPELAAHYGIYTFTLTNADGSTKKVSARFSYSYRKENGQWLITAHHSSALPEVPEDEIRALFTVWNSALATLDSSKVAALYAKDAILLPTVSNQVRTTPEAIKDYFDLFLTKKPQGVINESHVQMMGPALAAHHGIYTFTLTNPDGSTKQVGARFSFTYRKENGKWLIIEHHSSALPEPVTSPAAAIGAPTAEEIRGLFNVWNNALATLKPENVAALYAADGILLPTVSNKVRTTHAERVDYFTNFLKLKPQGVINESHVAIYANDLAAHYGVYTFTLTNEDGSTKKVGARFSYTYRKENGKWLIVEHHSSALPETVLPAESEIRGLFDKWNAALATLKPENVAALYAKDATLLPTVSNQVRTSPEQIVDYFTNFLKIKPQGVINESHVKIFSATLAAHYGIYTFTLTNPDGSTKTVGARFSYTYRKEGDQWLIIEHHSSALPEVPAPVMPSREEIAGLFSKWNAALATLNPEAVADMYAADATLLPTVSNKVRTNRAEIVDYFTQFLKVKPQGVINESHVNIMQPDLAAHYGIYTFTLTNADGSTKQVGARFSYTYRKENGKWLIIEHHSSALPEKALPSKEEIFNQFTLWNNALASLDSSKVADLYAPEAVLLPTVSNKVRTNRGEIIDYFNLFLTKKPQGVINESHISIMQPDLAQHNGIYTFTLSNADGSTQNVSARFSYTYRKEGQRWLITQHHSSALPEAVVAAPASSNGKVLVAA